MPLAGPAIVTVAILTFSVLITIPVLFLALQRQFIRSIASAGVEG